MHPVVVLLIVAVAALFASAAGLLVIHLLRRFVEAMGAA